MLIALIILAIVTLTLINLLINLSYHPASTTLGITLRGSSKNSMYTLSKEDSLRGLAVALLMLTHEHLAPTRRTAERTAGSMVLCTTVLTFSFTTPVVNANVQATTTQATAPAVTLGTSLYNTAAAAVPALTTEDGSYSKSSIMSYAHELASAGDSNVDYNVRLSQAMSTAWAAAKAQA